MNVKYMYVRNWDSKKPRNITIVSDLVEKEGKYIVDFAWAFCSNHDTFKKKDGRAIVNDRLNNKDNHYWFSVEVEKVKFNIIADKILTHILEHNLTPEKYIEDILNEIDYYESYGI